MNDILLLEIDILLKACHRPSSRDPETWIFLLLLQMDRLTEARWILGRLVAENRETSPANVFTKYSCLLRSEPTKGPSSSTGAVEVCLYGCQQNPRNVCLWLELGHAYDDRGDESAAERAWSHASQLDPTNPDVWAHLTLLYLKQNKLEIASHVHTPYPQNFFQPMS